MAEKRSYFWWRWLLFLLCGVAVAYGIFRPTPPPQIFHHSDKVGHILAFCALALTARLALLRARWFLFWPLMLGLAPLLEYLQGELRPLRVYSIEDSYANLFGVALALVLVLCLKTNALCRNK